MVLPNEDSVLGGAFTYQDIKSVNVIVIFEKSTGDFHKTRGCLCTSRESEI